MQSDLDEAAVDVGDGEESSTDVNVPAEGEKNVSPPSNPNNDAPSVEVEDSTKELEDYSSGVKGRINDLTKRFREEERQKQTAIQFAENVRKENDNLKSRLTNLDKGYLHQFEGRVDGQLQAAKKALKEAHENGDVDQIVEAQEVLSNISIEKSRLNIAKNNQPTQQEAPQQVAPQQAAPQYAPAPQPRPDPRAESWAGKNEWFGQDEVMTYAAFGLHRKLIEDEGFDPTSNNYYDELDTRMRREFPHKFESNSKSNGGRKVASAESSKSRNKSGRRTVRLTPSQVAIAKRLNVPLEEYAKYVRD